MFAFLGNIFFWSILLETHPDALQPTCSARSQKRQALHSSIPQTTQSNTACRSRHSQKTLKLLKQRTAVSFVSGGTYRTEEKSVGYPTQSQPHLLAGVMLLGKVDLSARAGNYFWEFPEAHSPTRWYAVVVPWLDLERVAYFGCRNVIKPWKRSDWSYLILSPCLPCAC